MAEFSTYTLFILSTLRAAFDQPPCFVVDIHTDPAGLQAILRPFPFPPVVLAPLNITHTAIFTEAIQKRLLHPDGTGLDGEDWKSKGKSDVRWMLSTLVTFFVSRSGLMYL